MLHIFIHYLLKRFDLFLRDKDRMSAFISVNSVHSVHRLKAGDATDLTLVLVSDYGLVKALSCSYFLEPTDFCTVPLKLVSKHLKFKLITVLHRAEGLSLFSQLQSQSGWRKQILKEIAVRNHTKVHLKTRFIACVEN